MAKTVFELMKHDVRIPEVNPIKCVLELQIDSALVKKQSIMP
jgi:hypothetical protein